MATTSKVAAGGLAAVLLLAGGLIARWEGVRYTAYPDPATGGAPWTVCYGSTKNVDRGHKYTLEECQAKLREDMLDANADVRRCVARAMPESVEAALTSLVFNLGPGPVCIEGRSPRRFARAGDWPNTCKSLDLYNKAGGRVYRGLVLRRADERAVCEGRA
jgi:lysozyme